MKTEIAEKKNSLDKLVQENLSGMDPKGPGYALYLQIDKKVVLEKYFGMANVECQVPVSKETVFNLGSISKLFVATSIGILHECGLLDWDKTLGHYMTGLSSPAANLVIREMMCHGSGLNDTIIGEVRSEKCPLDNQDIFNACLNYPERVVVSKRDKFRYSNLAYVLLCTLIEKVVETTFESFVRNHIANAAGMGSFHVFALPRRVIPNRADGYAYDKKSSSFCIQHPSVLTVGDGSVCVNMQDLVLFQKAFMKGRLVLPKTLETMLKPRIKIDSNVSYSQGWRVENFNEETLYFHSGTDAGFANLIACVPEKDITLCLLSNYASFFHKQNGLNRKAFAETLISEIM